MVRKKKPKLPAVGAAFAFPLGDGGFSVCRVLLGMSSERSTQWRGGTDVLVASSSWVGKKVPHVEDPALLPILYLTHHLWDNKPYVLWISEEPPQDFIPIGNIQPTLEEQAIPCMAVGGWSHLRLQPLAQWRWDNDRPAVLAEDVLKRQKEGETRLKVQQEREAYLRSVTLQDLRTHQFFANWKDYPPPKAIRASRKMMTDTVEDLMELGANALKEERMAILQRCIESFNRLEAQLQFIETIERDDICEEFEAIVHACGLGRHKDLADNWRDW